MADYEGLFSLEEVLPPPEIQSAETASVTSIRHSHCGISLVELEYRGREYFIVLNTDELDLDAADQYCQEVPLWWNPTVDPIYLY